VRQQCHARLPRLILFLEEVLPNMGATPSVGRKLALTRHNFTVVSL
jgi:hypothetical protein